MTIESDLDALLKAQCQNAFADFAPAGVVLPWVVYQFICGPSLRSLSGVAGDKRQSYVQVSAWAASRLQAHALIRAIEDALCASSAFTARPQAEPIDDADEALGYFGSIQDYMIIASR